MFPFPHSPIPLLPFFLIIILVISSFSSTIPISSVLSSSSLSPYSNPPNLGVFPLPPSTPSPINYDSIVIPSILSNFQSYRVLDYSLGFVLYWSIDVTSDSITIGYHANTLGWIGVGLSKIGLMIQSDVYVGYVTDTSDSLNSTQSDVSSLLNSDVSRVFVRDMFFGSRQILCPIGICEDYHQGGTSDVFNVTGYQTSTYTYVQFTRYLSTGDTMYDYDILPGVTNLIYAMSYDHQDNLQYHTNDRRGQLQHVWFTDGIIDTINSQNIQQVENAQGYNPYEVDSEYWIDQSDLLVIAVILLILHCLTVYFIRFLRAYRVFLLFHFILNILLFTLSLIFLVFLLQFGNANYTVHSSTYDLGFFLSSIIWSFSHSFYFLSFLLSRRYSSELTKLRLSAQLNGEPVDLTIRYVNLIHRVAEFCYRDSEIMFILLGVVSINLGLNSSVITSKLYYKQDTYYASFWLFFGYFAVASVLMQCAVIYLKLLSTIHIKRSNHQSIQGGTGVNTARSYLPAGGDREAGGTANNVGIANSTGGPSALVSIGDSKASAPVNHPLILKIAAVEMIGMIIIGILSIIMASNGYGSEGNKRQYGIYPSADSYNNGNSYSEYSSSSNSNSSLLAFPPVDPNNKQFLRTYYVAVEEVLWDYAPNGLVNAPDLPSYDPTMLNNPNFPNIETYPPPSAYITQDALHMGKVFKKAVYIRYTDATFTTVYPKTQQDEHLGILDFVIRAQVGDTIEVYFKNNAATQNYSLHPHGVFYNKGSEGAAYQDGAVHNPGDDVVPGGTYTYYWPVPVRSGPSSLESSDSVIWFIHSHVDELTDFDAGLLGAIIVYKVGACDSNRMSTTVDREYVLSFLSLDENSSPYYYDNIQLWSDSIHIPYSVLANTSQSPDNWYAPYADFLLLYNTPFQESNSKYSVNGYLFGNVPNIIMKVGEKVRFYLNNFGGTPLLVGDSIQFYGATVTTGGRRLDCTTLNSGSMLTVDMNPQVEGVFYIASAWQNYIRGGAIANFTVLPNPSLPTAFTPPSSLLNTDSPITYYISADEIQHQYMYSYLLDTNSQDVLPGGPAPNPYVQPNTPLPTLLKARYQMYTDGTFTTRAVSVGGRDSHLGIVGDIIRAETGQTVKIIFRNNLRFPCNLRPRGGVITFNATTLVQEDIQAEYVAVAPNTTVTYLWVITDQSGPSEDQLEQSQAWRYESSVDILAHNSAGLVGMMVITPAGTSILVQDYANGVGENLLGRYDLMYNTRPMDAEQEYFLMWYQIDETSSPYYPINMANISLISTFLAATVTPPLAFEFVAINGRMFGNVNGVNFPTGTTVRFYNLALGQADAVHSPTFHGNAVRMNGRAQSSVSLYAGMISAVTMLAVNPGGFKVFCHATTHGSAGQSMKYEVSGVRPQDHILSTITEQSPVVYYIGATLVLWDYNEWGYDKIHNVPYTGYYKTALYHGTDPNFLDVYGHPGSPLIGSRWWKMLYREYTDATFSTLKTYSHKQFDHLGMTGPIIRGDVGDVFEIHFANLLPMNPLTTALGFGSIGVNLMPHGGLDVIDEDTVGSVPIYPGESTVYHWYAGSQSAPGPNDPSSVSYLYHSTIDPEHDFYGGLCGVIIIDNKNSTYFDSEGVKHPIGVQNELIINFASMGEIFNPTPILFYNFAVLPFPPAFTPCTNATLQPWCDPSCGPTGNCFFTGPYSYLGYYGIFSIIIESINGFVLGGNMEKHDFVVQEGTTARIYMSAVGTAQDIHTIHWHAQTGVTNGRRLDVIEVSPWETEIYDMTPDNPGRYLIHCHVNLHFSMGMASTFVVIPQDADYTSYNGKYNLATNELSSSLGNELQIPGQNYFLSWRISPTDSSRIEITISSVGQTWLGFGISQTPGSGMVGAAIILCTYDVTTITPSCASRTGLAHTVPQLNSDLGGVDYVTLISSTLSDSKGRLSFTFSRPLTASDSFDHPINTNGATSIVFAVGPDWSINNWHGNVNRGITSVNFFSSSPSQSLSVSTSTLYNDSQFYLVHGLCMSVVWLTFAPIAVIIARFFKNHSWWLTVHRTLNSIVAFITVVMGVGMYVHSPHLVVPTKHSYLGSFIMAGVTLQFLVGISKLFIRDQTIQMGIKSTKFASNENSKHLLHGNNGRIMGASPAMGGAVTPGAGNGANQKGSLQNTNGSGSPIATHQQQQQHLQNHLVAGSPTLFASNSNPNSARWANSPHHLPASHSTVGTEPSRSHEGGQGTHGHGTNIHSIGTGQSDNAYYADSGTRLVSEARQRSMATIRAKLEKSVIRKTVGLFGTLTILTGFHRYVGYSLIIASFVNILLGLNLLYPSNITEMSQLELFEGLVGTTICIFGVIWLYFQETRRWRILSFLYSERGYANLLGSGYLQNQSQRGNNGTMMGGGDNANDHQHHNMKGAGGSPTMGHNNLKMGERDHSAQQGGSRHTPDQQYNNNNNPIGIPNSNANSSDNEANTSSSSSSSSSPMHSNDVQMSREEFNSLVRSGRHLLVMNGNVYDVEDFVDLHPGGSVVLQWVIGQDITDYFVNGSVTGSGHSHVHTAIARSIIEDYFIAKLAPKGGNPTATGMTHRGANNNAYGQGHVTQPGELSPMIIPSSASNSSSSPPMSFPEVLPMNPTMSGEGNLQSPSDGVTIVVPLIPAASPSSATSNQAESPVEGGGNGRVGALGIEEMKE